MPHNAADHRGDRIPEKTIDDANDYWRQKTQFCSYVTNVQAELRRAERLRQAKTASIEETA